MRASELVLLVVTSISLALPLVAHAEAEVSGLTLLENKAKERERLDYPAVRKLEEDLGHEVDELIKADSLQSGSDFQRAAFLCAVPEADLQPATRRYQLLLTALSLGDGESRKMLALSWDSLMNSTGRPGRILGDARYPNCLAPDLVRDVYFGKSKNGSASDNPEVQRIVDADQKMREGFEGFSKEEMFAMMKEDKARLKRIKEIVDSKDGLKTANDFANAALVCQHGEYFLDYALAHELSICSLLLGNKKASWLAGASYDRMLLSASYPQRFCTQYDGVGASLALKLITSMGINDRMRKAVVGKTMAESQALEK